MRADMAKVIVERPRVGSRQRSKAKGYRRRLQAEGLENLPRREGIKRPYGHNTKCLNEHLGPLGRYIEAQVGRPWNKVFAEICAFINRNSAVQDHVRDHVFDFVETDVVLVDGVPHRKAGAGRRPWGKGGPLEARGRWGGFYVCPLSGILKRVKRRRPGRQSTKPEAPVFVRVDESRQCRLIGGRWHLVEVKKLPVPLATAASARSPRVGPEPRDVLLDRPATAIDEAEARRFYGAAVYATAHRPLSKRELQQSPVPVDLWKGLR
jgi:hypothetical protein